MKGEKPSRKPGLQKWEKGEQRKEREDQETVKYRGGIWLGFMEIYYLERLQMAQVRSVRTRNRTTQMALAIYYNDRGRSIYTYTHLQ